MFWKRKRERAEREFFEAMWDREFPRITIEEHRAAVERLAHEEWRMTPFGPIRTGYVIWDDLRKANGYYVHAYGRDRFGWPKGDPQSPAQISS